MDPEEATSAFLDDGFPMPKPSSQWRKRLAAPVAGALLLVAGVVAVTVAPATAPARQILGGAAILLAEKSDEGEQKECAASGEEDCSKSRCCKDMGYQCYEKSKGWAVCMEECDSDEMEKYDPNGDEWSCKPLGERTRCAKDGEDCASFGCCETSGTQCYTKNKFWSACMTGCDSEEMKKSDPDNETWQCDPVGERNFKTSCSWAGEDCSETKCCNNKGFTCAVKDETFAGCTMTTKKTTWVSQYVPIPDGWEGTVLGEGRDEYEIQPAGEGQDMAGTSLFCVMVYMPNSTEEGLMWLAKKNGVSIFGCNESMTLHSWESAGGGWDTGETTLVNTDVFLDAFEKIRQDGRWKKHDWLVKADPDCVFFADRLRSHLWALRPPPYVPMYLKNNHQDPGLGNSGFLGAIEVFSKPAMDVYFANWEGCKQFLGVDSGEDGFFKGCMDAIGVGFMTDGNMFDPDYSPQACVEGDRVAYHPIKEEGNWQCCVDIVMGVERHAEFGECTDNDQTFERPWFQEDA